MAILLDGLIFQKLLRFGFVGGIGMCIDFFITWNVKDRLLLNKYFANSCGFTVAVMSNFLLNYYWTFHSSGNMTHQLGLFFCIALAALVLNNLLIYIFTGKFLINFYLSKAIAILLVFTWNFSFNYFFNFSSR